MCFLGKVKKIMPGLNAAFVDVGYEKDAFYIILILVRKYEPLTNMLNLAYLAKQTLHPTKRLSLKKILKKQVKLIRY